MCSSGGMSCLPTYRPLYTTYLANQPTCLSAFYLSKTHTHAHTHTHTHTHTQQGNAEQATHRHARHAPGGDKCEETVQVSLQGSQIQSPLPVPPLRLAVGTKV